MQRTSAKCIYAYAATAGSASALIHGQLLIFQCQRAYATLSPIFSEEETGRCHRELVTGSARSKVRHGDHVHGAGPLISRTAMHLRAFARWRNRPWPTAKLRGRESTGHRNQRSRRPIGRLSGHPCHGRPRASTHTAPHSDMGRHAAQAGEANLLRIAGARHRRYHCPQLQHAVPPAAPTDEVACEHARRR